MRIAVDTGGTFTDCVYLRDGKIHVLKVFSTPSNPAEAIIGALRKIVKPEGQTASKQIPGSARNDKHEILEVRHGTTVGTNTLLERTGARVAFVTTAGFEDTIAIGRQARPRLYDWFVVPDPPLAPPDLRFGAPERTSATGEILKSPGAEDLQTLCAAVAAARPEAVAISLLFSFANPKNEQTLAEALSKLGVPVSLSHEIMPEFREYERASTVVANAYLAPKMGRYISGLQRTLDEEFAGGRLQVMQSSGGIASAQVAAKEPVRTVLSGPAGGVVGAYAVARMAGFEKIIGFDMGGTSTDVALVDGGDHPNARPSTSLRKGSSGARRGPRTEGLRTTNESFISGLPISVPTLDIHSVGAGGGSLARFDAGGALRVGPQSAGADPGPVCYGRGTEPTVTDANLVLGRLDPEFFLGGREGDLTSQIGACRVGAQRLEEMTSKYGLARVRNNMRELLDYSERLVRAELAKLPAGEYAAEDFMDDDGVSERPIRIRVTLRIDPRRKHAQVDFTGTDPQVAGSINAVEAITYSATYYVFRCLLGDDVPATAGIMRPIELIAPPGTIVNARPPAAVAGGNVETSQRTVDVLLRALAQAAPDRVPAASAGTMTNVTIGGMDTAPRSRQPFAYYETTAGGMGARPGLDGVPGVHTHMTNSLNTPVEALEYAYPFRVRRYGYRCGSGGGGRYRGGDGLVREIELLTDSQVTILADRRKFAPYGLAGGEAGATGKASLIRNNGQAEELPGKCNREAHAGDVVRIETPGGGGWGKPGSGG